MSTGVICVQTLRLCARTCPSQNIKWWGLEKKLDHRRDFCRTLAPLLPHAHIIPLDTRHLRLQIRGGGNIEAWWSWSWHDPLPPGPRPLHPAPALTPCLAQISGDPAWLTQGTLPPPPPSYLTLSRHLRRSKVQNTARFGGIKTKLQGHSQ